MIDVCCPLYLPAKITAAYYSSLKYAQTSNERTLKNEDIRFLEKHVTLEIQTNPNESVDLRQWV